MGIIKNIKIKKRKKENELYFLEEEKIQKPIKIELNKNNYNEAYNLAIAAYESNMFDSYYMQTKLTICIILIDLCYKLNKDEEADEYINMYIKLDSSLNGELHKTKALSYYEIGKVMYKNKRESIASLYLKKAYDLSEGILFLTKEDKEIYLKFLNIKDNRTFEDFAEEY